jgi:glutathionylspermidine synthase
MIGVAPTAASAFRPVDPLPPAAAVFVRRRAIFECCKWDPQVEDICTIADVPLVLDGSAWRELGAAAEALAREAAAAEDELRARPELHGRLGLPRGVVRALRQGTSHGHRNVVRFVRFDFHLTSGGWRISEANTDVPGGLNEASGLPRIMAPHFPGTRAVGDVSSAYADAILDATGDGARVALVHATAYTDDRQVLAYLAKTLVARGAQPVLVSPAHLRWRDGRAALLMDSSLGNIDAVVRFFPAEWMPNLPRACGWPSFFSDTVIPLSNAATAILTQSKRFPLVWDALPTTLKTWRALLPATRDPREVRWQGSDEWVLKPALGRVGEDIGIAGVTPAKEWERIAKSVRRYPDHWIAQRRFEATPVTIDGRSRYPSVGVYTVNSRVAGAYGRIAERPLVDARAQDAAVLLAE